MAYRLYQKTGETTFEEVALVGGGGGESVPVVDNLTSTAVTSALSANQGRVIDDKKAEKSNTVTTNTPQTISGTKTITGNLVTNGKTLSPTELGYLDGVSSSIQTQLNGKVGMEFTDSGGVKNYIGKTVGVVATSGGHIFTNCDGYVQIVGNNAWVHIVNSPQLNVVGKTAENFHNIVIDGIASFKNFKTGFCFENSATRYGLYEETRTGLNIEIQNNNDGAKVVKLRGGMWCTNGLSIKQSVGDENICILIPPQIRNCSQSKLVTGVYNESSFVAGFALEANEYVVAQSQRGRNPFIYIILRNIGGGGVLKYSRISGQTVIVQIDLQYILE